MGGERVLQSNGYEMQLYLRRGTSVRRQPTASVQSQQRQVEGYACTTHRCFAHLECIALDGGAGL